MTDSLTGNLAATSPLVARLRVAYHQWNASKGLSSDCWLEMFDNRVSLFSLADGQPGARFSRQRYGLEEAHNYFLDVADEWRMNYYKVTDYIEQGNRIVAIGSCSWMHKKTEKSFHTSKVDIWVFERGKITKFAEYYDTARLLSAGSH
jgi:uncharacterized protein